MHTQRLFGLSYPKPVEPNASHVEWVKRLALAFMPPTSSSNCLYCKRSPSNFNSTQMRKTSFTFWCFIYMSLEKKKGKHQRWALQQSTIAQLALSHFPLVHCRRSASRVFEKSLKNHTFPFYHFISLQNNFFLLSSQQGARCPVKVFHNALEAERRRLFHSLHLAPQKH